MPFVLEGLMTTLDANGILNVAPMGLIPDDCSGKPIQQFLLRPFPQSTTCNNLLESREAVFHLNDQVELYARAVTHQIDLQEIATFPAQDIQGRVLSASCTAYELRVTEVDSSEQRIAMQAEVVRTHRLRDFLGFNRARHAVIEAAIMASRVHLLPADQIQRELSTFQTLIEKTADPATAAAMQLIVDWIGKASKSRQAVEECAP